MTIHTLTEARAIADSIINGTSIRYSFETLSAAFHKLDKSTPSIATVRDRDIRRAKAIWDHIGKPHGDILTRDEYIDCLRKIYRCANLSDSEFKADWMRGNECAAHCQPLDQIVRDMGLSDNWIEE